MEKDKDLFFRMGKMFENFEKVGLNEFKGPTSLVSINILLGKFVYQSVLPRVDFL